MDAILETKSPEFRQRQLLSALRAHRRGDFSVRLPADLPAIEGEIAETFNDIVERNESLAKELARMRRSVGRDGRIGERVSLGGATGRWAECIDSMNELVADMVKPTTEIARVIGAVAKGDLSQTMETEADGRPLKGEFLRIARTVNTMVQRLGLVSSEVTRVAREVGTEGKLGGEARVEGVAGTWKDLTDNVNAMATNLTNQVRGIAEVMTAVAHGNLKRKLSVDAKGEIAALADTINGMIETLATFADQVTNVAREVGIEGQLGGQARVPGAAGLWRDLTDNVNQLAANLTTQVRAIAEVATAVTKGDLTRAIAVEASGEVAALKDNINQMIANLRETTQYNTEQDWLKTNLARFTRKLQGERDLVTVCNLILSELAPLVNAHQGMFYVARTEAGEPLFELIAAYAGGEPRQLSTSVRLREGLVGQCAFEKQRILIAEVPGNYIPIRSGLGEAPPLNLIVLPALFEGEVRAVIELASFNRFNDIHVSFLEQLVESIGIVLNTIAANMRTEGLLEQSQMLTGELQSQQEELKKTNDRLEQQAASLRQSEELLKTQQDELRTKNEELQENAQQLQAEKRQVEAVNREVEEAKQALEEKAEQLALTSRYKSEFLANMSHELRTPLNSLLILSRLLSDNFGGNLETKQIEYARTIHGAGTDLLSLINDILDLSKIESGTVTLHVVDMTFSGFVEHTERTFSQIAQEKKLRFDVELDSRLPEVMRTDEKRLQQIVHNLLSNAFKFVETGRVALRIRRATSGWSREAPNLAVAEQVVAFEIEDTGIGIPAEHQKLIFEAFQQADGTTNRRYGGTGLGLSISRELAKLLGGEIGLRSVPGEGSTFTLFVPQTLDLHSTAGGGHAGRRPPVALSSDSATARRLVSSDWKPAAEPREKRAGPLLLIAGADPELADLLLEVAREEGFNGMTARDGEEVLSMAGQQRVDAIALDVGLPDMDGWALLDLLKHYPETCHIPLYLVAAEGDRALGLAMGAFGIVGKSATRGEIAADLRRLRELLGRVHRRTLLVTQTGGIRRRLIPLLDGEDIEIETTSIAKASSVVDERQFDCVVMAPGRNPEKAVELVASMRRGKRLENIPVILYQIESLAELDSARYKELGIRAISGPDVDGLLVDEAARALHRRGVRQSDRQAHAVQNLHRRDPLLAGRKIAIIDDDIRNIFSLTSVLEEYQMEVFHAENGGEGLELLERVSQMDAVLVDIMMPGMDGYDLIREINQRNGQSQLPVIAVTAKAMKGDRAKCLEAGASDYVSKPVDIERLLSVLRVRLRQ
ncbi:MAG: response regulator [Kiloniellales bacterium]